MPIPNGQLLAYVIGAVVALFLAVQLRASLR